jgi:ubiquinone/menaquinone biosynthesis C-methylase UbiE
MILGQISIEDKSIVDLCAGSGRFTIPLLRMNKLVASIDMSQGSLDLLMRNCEKENLSTSMVMPICSRAQSIPLPDEWADCVLFIQAFQYFPVTDHDMVLSEINRCLHKKGKLIIDTFCYDSILLRLLHMLCP